MISLEIKNNYRATWVSVFKNKRQHNIIENNNGN
jgi:hypothetical protein